MTEKAVVRSYTTVISLYYILDNDKRIHESDYRTGSRVLIPTLYLINDKREESKEKRLHFINNYVLKRANCNF